MISVIVCSRSTKLFTVFEKSLASSIGVDFEVIRIDNELNQYSITEAYNLGVQMSKYEHLCFCHEDVVFKTVNWGSKVLDHLSHSGIGIIGVAGSDTFSNVPNGWWVQSKSNKLAVNMEQGLDNVTKEFRDFALFNDIDLSKSTYAVCTNVSEAEKTRVVVIDGFWFCCAKKIFDTIGFDETLLKGFHGYDVDISLSVNQRYDNYVVGDILLEHKSVGHLTRLWVDSALAIASKWREPEVVSVRELTACEKASYKSTSLFSFCNSLSSLSYGAGVFRKVIGDHFRITWLSCNFKISIVLLMYYLLGSTGTKIIREFLWIKHKLKKLWSQ